MSAFDRGDWSPNDYGLSQAPDLSSGPVKMTRAEYKSERRKALCEKWGWETEDEVIAERARMIEEGTLTN